VSTAPEVFELGADDIAVVLESSPAEGLREKVEDAVGGCPRAAIRLEAE
jgi:ferredoxin